MTSSRTSLAIVYGVAALPFVVGLVFANLPAVTARIDTPVLSKQTAVSWPNGGTANANARGTECDQLSGSERSSCREALDAAIRDERTQRTGDSGLDSLRARTRAEIDAGDADHMVAEPRCSIQTRNQNDVCEMQFDKLPVRTVTAGAVAPARRPDTPRQKADNVI